MQCPECGTGMAAGLRFCHHCGWDSKLAAAGKAVSRGKERPAWKRWTMSGTLIASLFLVLWLLLLPQEQAEAALMTNQPAPLFELDSVTGERVRLSDMTGKVVVLNFWATWCLPCRKEMPDLQAVYDQYKEQGLQVVGINVGESQVAVTDYQRRVGVNFPLLLDVEETAQTAYRILPLPTTFFVDRQGVIRGIFPYQMSREQIEVEVLRLLSR